MKKNTIISSLVLLIIFLTFNVQLLAQGNVEFSKSNFKDDVTGYKIAVKQLQEADYKSNANLYKEALETYLTVNQFNPNNAELNGKIGECYTHESNNKKALEHLEKAYKLDNNLDGFYIYLLASVYHHSNNFNDAIKYYRLSKSKGSKIPGAYMAGVDKSIKEAAYGKKLVKTPINVEIDNLSEAVNTANEEYVPVINADETEMYFTSRRKENVGGVVDIGLGDYFEDIYYTNKENGKWTESVNLGEPVNSSKHDATVNLSLDGQKLFLYRDDDKGIGNIYMAEKKGDNWLEPVKLPSPINSKKNQETSACFSFDGNTIYFVSDRDGGKGGKDIYRSSKNKDGEWGDAENLGVVINTVEDEDAIFLHPDGKTLYFSSKGHATMGGYDVFMSVNTNGKWSKPKNIGYPVNTADDDVCFVLTASGDYGYYTSIKEEGKGRRDIYRVAFLDEINKPKLTLLKGVVSDRKTDKKLIATVEIYDNTEDKLVGTFETNSATGRFMVSLPAGRDYGISVKATGYLFYSENFNVPDTAAFQVVEKFIKLDKLEVGKKVVLNNIFYDYNKASLRESSFNELSKVVDLLKANPKMKIEFSAHTDSRGGDAYNNNLSQERAQSCVDYLLKKGIAKDRLVAKGYGEKKLVVTDAEIEKIATEIEKEAAHQKNRRTEFKILAN